MCDKRAKRGETCVQLEGKINVHDGDKIHFKVNMLLSHLKSML